MFSLWWTGPGLSLDLERGVKDHGRRDGPASCRDCRVFTGTCLGLLLGKEGGAWMVGGLGDVSEEYFYIQIKANG